MAGRHLWSVFRAACLLSIATAPVSAGLAWAVSLDLAPAVEPAPPRMPLGAAPVDVSALELVPLRWDAPDGSRDAASKAPLGGFILPQDAVRLFWGTETLDLAK